MLVGFVVAWYQDIKTTRKIDLTGSLRGGIYQIHKNNDVRATRCEKGTEWNSQMLPLSFVGPRPTLRRHIDISWGEIWMGVFSKPFILLSPSYYSLYSSIYTDPPPRFQSAHVGFHGGYCVSKQKAPQGGGGNQHAFSVHRLIARGPWPPEGDWIMILDQKVVSRKPGPRKALFSLVSLSIWELLVLANSPWIDRGCRNVEKIAPLMPDRVLQ